MPEADSGDSAELRSDAYLYRAYLDAAPDPIFSLAPDGRYAYANRALGDAFGKPAEDIVGMSLWDFFPKEEADQRFGVVSQVLRSGQEATYEGPVGDRVFLTVLRPIRDSAGRVVSAICSSRDITERAQTEEALRTSEARLVKAQALARVGNWELDLATRTLWASAEAFRIYGFDPSPSPYVPLLTAQNAVAPEDRARLDGALRALLESETPYDEEFRILGADDEPPRTIHSVAQLLRDASGAPVRVAGVLQDVTERKRAEAEKARLEGQLQRAQKMESVGRLAGGVAHDFNNMLGVILGHTELALEQVDPSLPLHGDLMEIRDAARRSVDLTRQLLAFARKQTIAPRVLDLNETIAGMLKMLQRLIGEDVCLRWQPGVDLWPVRADPSQIDQILANLCVNARDAITGVGRLTIETANKTFDEDYCAAHAGYVPGDYVRFAVSDDGAGMDKETLAHLFEPFFTTKGVGKGTGLGLATVYGIVKQNDGFISVYSEPGTGTTFKIFLPRHVGAGQQAVAFAAGPAAHGHETILLVEDEPAILRMTRTLLQRLGYTVVAAATPGEAIHFARQYAGAIHLLMTDVVMPEMNGRDLAKNLLSVFPGLKRLFMSGYTANVIAHHGVLDEGVNFIQKPFSAQDLAAKVRAALDDQGAAS
jgi:PAS domain S-box-containing protein